MANYKSAVKEVKIGATFRYTHADSNPLWIVKASKGAGCWVAEIVNEPVEINGQMIDSDWVGTKKVFSTEEIASLLLQEKAWKNLRNTQTSFFASLKVGQIIHYNHGFDEYVRCEIVNVKGENVCKPIGLVGQWSNHNLPRRLPNGSVERGYFGEMMDKGETFQPNFSCVVESPCYKAKPNYTAAKLAAMPLIDLSVPPMTKEQEEVSKLINMKREFQTMLDKVHDKKTFGEFLNYVNTTSVKLPLDFFA